jgi:hypothetical protein
MLSVAVLYADQESIAEHTPFQLVSAEGTVIASAGADAGGVVTFDVDPTSVGQVAIRLDREALEKIELESRRREVKVQEATGD